MSDKDYVEIYLGGVAGAGKFAKVSPEIILS